MIPKIGQMELITAIMREIDRQGVHDLNHRQMNTIIKAADEIVLQVSSPTVPSKPNMGLQEWSKTDDTGASSLRMASVLVGGRHQDYAHPEDPDDFGRCYRFLQAVPEARARLGIMSNDSKVWAEYVRHWEEMEELWEAESYSELGDLMAKLKKKSQS